jgi:hypothetical protein
MAIEFYDLKLKKKVNIDQRKVRKVTFETEYGTRYGLKTTTDDGHRLTRFVTNDYWDTVNCPDEDVSYSPEEGDDLPR